MVPLSSIPSHISIYNTKYRNNPPKSRAKMPCTHKGMSNHAIAKQLGLSRPTVIARHVAFADDGLIAFTGRYLPLKEWSLVL